MVGMVVHGNSWIKLKGQQGAVKWAKKIKKDFACQALSYRMYAPPQPQPLGQMEQAIVVGQLGVHIGRHIQRLVREQIRAENRDPNRVAYLR